MPEPRTVIGLSGGVDSAVAALLLRRAGVEVVGVTLRLHPCDGDAGTARSCCGAAAVEEARKVARHLDLPFYVLDCQAEFAAQVLRPCWDEYDRGRTPNPCVLCNERIKFGRLLEFATSLGADSVATGHYARIEGGPDGPRLRRGTDRNKDQSYFLFSLSPAQLRACRFPLGSLTKPEVRRLATEHGLPNAVRAESQDICFAAHDGGFGEFLRDRFGAPARPGPLLDTTGRVLGRHAGIHRFTIGQRRGLQVALGRPAWVRAVRAEDGAVVLTTEPRDLLANGLRARGLVWHRPLPLGTSVAVSVQARYRQEPVPAEVTAGEGDTAVVRFERPGRAVAPGQAAVFYEGETVLGGGWIEAALA